MAGKRKQYTPEFKFKVVLESLQREMKRMPEPWIQYRFLSLFTRWAAHLVWHRFNLKHDILVCDGFHVR